MSPGMEGGPAQNRPPEDPAAKLDARPHLGLVAGEPLQLQLLEFAAAYVRAMNEDDFCPCGSPYVGSGYCIHNGHPEPARLVLIRGGAA